MSIKHRLSYSLPVFAACLFAAVAAAQPPFGGGGFRGGDRGSDRGGDSGGFRGGPPGGGFRGGPPGGGSPFGGMSDFIRRMDTNGNGMIDPNEREGRFGDFISRIAESSRGIDPNRPIPIDRLSEAMDRYRQERMRGGDSRGGDSRDSNSSGGYRGRSSGSNEPEEPEPLVPGFDVLEEPLPVAGFGTGSDLLIVQVTDPDRREAEDRMRRYDRNHDGKLTKDEIGQGRWSDDPFQFDANHDGILSSEELAVRYARRRVDRANEQASRESSSNSGSSNGSGDSSRSSSSRFGFFSRGRDENGGDERRGFGGFGGDSGRGGFRGFGGDRGGGGDRGFGGGDRGYGDYGDRADYSFQKDKTPPPPKSYKFAAKELPKGLPDWFARQDTDGDGQVMMVEFAQDWTDAVAIQFDRYDRNHDGVITPSECLVADADGTPARVPVPAPPARSRSGGTDPGTNSGRDERSTTPPDVPEPSLGSPGDEDSPGTSPMPAVSPPTAETAKVDPRYLDFARKQVDRYDKNGDGVLTAEEWSEMSASLGVGAADINGDGKVTPEEFAIKLGKR